MTATTDTGLTVGGLDGQFVPRRPSLAINGRHQGSVFVSARMSLDSILVSWVTPAAIGLVEQSILDFVGEQSGGKFSAKLQDTSLAQPTCGA